MTIFSDLYLEYLDDIANFDFMALKSQGFDISEIEEFIAKAEIIIIRREEDEKHFSRSYRRNCCI